MNKPFVHLLFLLVILAGCGKQEKSTAESILAEVGAEVITVRDFELSYEFGFANQVTGDSPQKKYLDKMIAELILAQEGYAQKLDTTSSIQHGVNTIKAERLIEEVFNVKVLEQIEVSDEEIRAEINKSAVSFQLKFLPAQSEPHAQFLKQEVEEKGYSQVLAGFSNEMMQGEIDESDFQTPFLAAEEIDPMLLMEITDLEINQISEPVFFNQQWFLFMVSNIKRQPLAPEDYEAKKETYRKVVYNRKAMQGAERFVEELMSPLDVRTKREVFIPLSGALQQWLIEENPTGNMKLRVISGDKEYHKKIERLFEKTLVEFDGEVWSVEDFLEVFNPGLYQLRPNDQKDFRIQFSDAIALAVRDYQLLKIAQQEELYNKPEVQREIKAWENKWVFQSMRAKFYDELSFSDEVVRDYFNTNKHQYSFSGSTKIKYDDLSEALKTRIRKEYLNTRLLEYVDELKSKYEVKIYEEKLAELKPNNSKKNPLLQVQLFKQNSNRMAFPVVDPNW